MLRINCAPIWLYLQVYTAMHGQQNIKKKPRVSKVLLALPKNNLQDCKFHL